MNISFIILAGGESKRFNSKTPKPYHLYKGKPLLMHSIDRVKSYKKFKKIVIVVNKNHTKFIKKLKIPNIKIIKGGRTRAESAFKGLNSLKNSNTKYVMIHDAADVPQAISQRGSLSHVFCSWAQWDGGLVGN